MDDVLSRVAFEEEGGDGDTGVSRGIREDRRASKVQRELLA